MCNCGRACPPVNSWQHPEEAAGDSSGMTFELISERIKNQQSDVSFQRPHSTLASLDHSFAFRWRAVKLEA